MSQVDQCRSILVRLAAAIGILCVTPALSCEFTPIQIQSEALSFLQKEYPNDRFERGNAIDVIVMGEAEVGLQSLRRKLCQTNPSPNQEQRSVMMRAHFQEVIPVSRAAAAWKPPANWADAQSVIMLQLMPSDYLRDPKDKKALVARPFVTGVELAVVIDEKGRYGYVREEDRARWNVDVKTLFETALKNLDRANVNAKLQGGGDADKFLAMEEKDGYDAVRLLVPWIRQEAAKFLGDPFIAAMPNRDFLIMWSTKNSAQFQDFAKSRIRDDFAKQPYPLTSKTLKVWANGRVELER
jgi:uncharacterized protein YtpQ (UPF0354 family)